MESASSDSGIAQEIRESLTLRKSGERDAAAGLARKPERSVAQGMRDSNTTGLTCELLCFVATKAHAEAA